MMLKPTNKKEEEEKEEKRKRKWMKKDDDEADEQKEGGGGWGKEEEKKNIRNEQLIYRANPYLRLRYNSQPSPPCLPFTGLPEKRKRNVLIINAQTFLFIYKIYPTGRGRQGKGMQGRRWRRRLRGRRRGKR